MFDPKYRATCRVIIDGRIDIEDGEFYLTATKTKEASCNWSGKRTSFADDVMSTIVRTTDIRENELTLALAQYQVQNNSLKEPRMFPIGEKIERR
ncbi:MAG: hypothetical protein NWE95_01815 [Candidatus Bathyarchaeota archaeon]|nr:hypothetical protein [Candidatus Bathyarchaeota archaeon]